MRQQGKEEENWRKMEKIEDVIFGLPRLRNQEMEHRARLKPFQTQKKRISQRLSLLYC